METRADYVLVGGFVLAILACLVVAVLWLARVQFNAAAATYDIFLTGSVTGLTPGAPVRYNGIPVGRVTDVQLDPQNQQRVRVTVEVNTRTPIKVDAVASLEVQGLTGGAFIEISGGSPDAPPLERQPGERHPVIASRPSGLQQVVTSAPEVLSRLIVLADRLNEILDEHNQAAMAETLENVRRFTATLAARSGDIDATIADGAAAVRDLRLAIAATSKTADELRQLVAPGGELVQALKGIDATSRRASEVAGHLDALVQENRQPVRDFSQRGLSEMQQLVADARALVAEMTRIADTLRRDPARFLYGERREGYQPR
jgi:phospholipid/cholesterol/gamma-HCH transport system substrate-binding protein